MKPRFTVITILISMALIATCSDDHAKAAHNETNSHADHQSSETQAVGMTLNNGEKWPMDEHTRNSFSEMEEVFFNADHVALEGKGLKQLGSDLQADLDGLIKGCTMTGEAHNQLHVYLTGYIPAVQELSKTGNLEDAKKVKHYLEIYDDYLE